VRSQAASSSAPASIDRVFLDGSHDGESVAADLEAWSTRLKPEGILAGHDYAPKYDGLRAAVDAFAACRGLEVCRGPRDIWFYARKSCRQAALPSPSREA
jgi:hypothetical protein